MMASKRTHSTQTATRYRTEGELFEAVFQWAVERHRTDARRRLANLVPAEDIDAAVQEAFEGRVLFLQELIQPRNLQAEARKVAERCRAAVTALEVVAQTSVSRAVQRSVQTTKEKLDQEATRQEAKSAALPGKRDARAMLALSFGVAYPGERTMDFSMVGDRAAVDANDLLEASILAGLVTTKDFASLVMQAKRKERDWPTRAEGLEVERKRLARFLK